MPARRERAALLGAGVVIQHATLQQCGGIFALQVVDAAVRGIAVQAQSWAISSPASAYLASTSGIGRVSPVQTRLPRRRRPSTRSRASGGAPGTLPGARRRARTNRRPRSAGTHPRNSPRPRPAHWDSRRCACAAAAPRSPGRTSVTFPRRCASNQVATNRRSKPATWSRCTWVTNKACGIVAVVRQVGRQAFGAAIDGQPGLAIALDGGRRPSPAPPPTALPTPRKRSVQPISSPVARRRRRRRAGARSPARTSLAAARAAQLQQRALQAHQVVLAPARGRDAQGAAVEIDQPALALRHRTAGCAR